MDPFRTENADKARSDEKNNGDQLFSGEEKNWLKNN